MWSAIRPICRPARAPIPSGTCLVLLQTGGLNPLTDTVVPLVLCVHVSVSLVPRERGRRSLTGVFLTSCPDASVLPSSSSLYLLYLVSVIQATSWSRAGLISFTPREELVCGQTAHYGDDPAALQVTN